MYAKLTPDEDLRQYLPCKMMYVSGTWLPLGKPYPIRHDLALLYLLDKILPYSIYQTGLCLIGSLR